ncbi:hypothetical protein, partial [uncultured Gammaproteobacteria bacterium]
GCLCLEFEKMAGDSHYFFVLAKWVVLVCLEWVFKGRL